MDKKTADNHTKARGERLDSWKEIAAYLKRDIRTVQRWEKQEGLPVHRHLHDERGTAYAYAGEIDDWLQNRSHPADTAAPPDSPGSGPSPEGIPPPSARTARRLPVLIAVALACGATAFGIWALSRPRADSATLSSLSVLCDLTGKLATGQ